MGHPIGPEDPSWDPWNIYGPEYGPQTPQEQQFNKFYDWAYDMQLDELSRKLVAELPWQNKVGLMKKFPHMLPNMRIFNAILTTAIKKQWPDVYKSVKKQWPEVFKSHQEKEECMCVCVSVCMEAQITNNELTKD